MGTIVVTGSSGGIGQATVVRLRQAGHRVLGVDLHGSEVTADLARPEGRLAMTDAIAALVGSPDQGLGRGLDGVVAAAGITGPSAPLVLSVNYFGAIATIDGLRPLLRPGGAVVAIASNSATTYPGMPTPVVDACLAGDERAAHEAVGDDVLGAYPASKLALARWVRRIAPAWARGGLRINAVAPGLIATPMTDDLREVVLTQLSDVYPVPVGRPGEPNEVAAAIDLLLGPDGGFFHGSVVVMDGGTEAALRPDEWPSGF